MTKNEAIQILKPLRNMMIDENGHPISDAVFAIDKAIEVLSVIRCKDCKYWRKDWIPNRSLAELRLQPGRAER